MHELSELEIINYKKINKSEGTTPTEKLLGKLCESTFLKLWTYPNPHYKQTNGQTKELCDVIAIFEDHVFLFFDRESKPFENNENDIELAWKRWEREVISNQTKSAQKNTTKLRNHRENIFLDPQCLQPLPIKIPEKFYTHRIIVAHGAEEACKNHSPDNIYGSLAISYSDEEYLKTAQIFCLNLKRENPVHVFDSFNLDLMLQNLDTFYDFKEYILAKEEAIENYEYLLYAGEEDLLAYYYQNYNINTKKYIIGPDTKCDHLIVDEGAWKKFSTSNINLARIEANKISFIWDEFINTTSQNALDGIVKSNRNIFENKNSIYEMAKEPRLIRRQLSQHITNSIYNFPENMHRSTSFMNSFYENTSYVFMQFLLPDQMDYEKEYRPFRRMQLEIACAMAKIHFPHLTKVIGIGIEPPKLSSKISEDFILFECDSWSKEETEYYQELNKYVKIFETMKPVTAKINEFPSPQASQE